MDTNLVNDQSTIPRREPLVDAVEMARLLGCSQRWVTDAARYGRIPAVPLGNKWRFDAEDVMSHLRSPAIPRPQITGIATAGDATVTNKSDRRRFVVSHAA